MDTTTMNPEGRAFSIKLWPPSQTTRLLLVERMANNLSTPSIFTRKYGSLSKEEARENAKQIEERPYNQAEELLRPLKEPGNSYTKICFSNRSFGLGAARVAEPILASLKDQLKEVDLSDFIAGRSEGEALEVMAIFSEALEGCVLKSLDLSNNALGEKGVRAFGALLKSQSSLEELYLMNDGISEEAARAVCELIPSTEKLRVLQFHNNMTGDEGALAISEVAYLSYLNLEDEGAVAIANVLKESASALEVMEMAGNDITAEAAPALAACIAAKQLITKLNLAENELRDEGAIQISKALEDGHAQLKEVDLSSNFMRRAGARCLARAVVKSIFNEFPNVLGSLDENDPEGEDDNESGEGEDEGDELESKLKNLEVHQED
ncbi:unnamed protein product, partial [Vitis vinifera]